MPAWNIDTKVQFAPVVAIGANSVNMKPDFTLIINNAKYFILKDAALLYSAVLKERIMTHQDEDVFSLDSEFEALKELDVTSLKEVAKFFQWKPIEITDKNVEAFILFSKHLQIPFLAELLKVFDYVDRNADRSLTNSCPALVEWEKLEGELFDELDLVRTCAHDEIDLKKLTKHLLNFCVSRPNRIEDVVTYVSGRENLYPLFNEYMLKRLNKDDEFSGEISFAIEKMLATGRLKFADLKKIDPERYPFNLIQYVSDEKILNQVLKAAQVRYPQFRLSIEILKDQNWKLQREFSAAGVNPSEIAVAIRNDDLKSLKLLFRGNNEMINPSPYERCTYINLAPHSLIEYAEFFGALKCFSYLQLNKARVLSDSFRYAVCGGNSQIMRICEEKCNFQTAPTQNPSTEQKSQTPNDKSNESKDQDHQVKDRKVVYQSKNQASLIKETLKAAILYHRADVCERFFVYDLDILRLCVEFCQTQVFLNFIKESGGNADRLSALLFECSRCNCDGLLEILLRLDEIDVNARQELTLKCPIHVCCENGAFECLDLFSKHEGIDLDAKNPCDDDNTCLHYACRDGDKKTVALLFESPFFGDVNVRNVYGLTPLHYASQCKNNLVVNNANSNEKAVKNTTTEVVELLLKKPKCDGGAKTKHDYTPLHLACEAGNSEIAEVLIKTGGLDYNQKGFYNNTPIYFAAKSNSRETALVLLKKKDLEINARGDGGNTALHLACIGGHKRMVELLLKKKGIDVNAKNREGKTPKQCTTKDDIIKLLDNFKPTE